MRFFFAILFSLFTGSLFAFEPVAANWVHEVRASIGGEHACQMFVADRQPNLQTVSIFDDTCGAHVKSEHAILSDRKRTTVGINSGKEPRDRGLYAEALASFDFHQFGPVDQGFASVGGSLRAENRSGEEAEFLMSVSLSIKESLVFDTDTSFDIAGRDAYLRIETVEAVGSDMTAKGAVFNHETGDLLYSIEFGDVGRNEIIIPFTERLGDQVRVEFDAEAEFSGILMPREHRYNAAGLQVWIIVPEPTRQAWWFIPCLLFLRVRSGRSVTSGND